jgi:hypothetical protein
MKRVAWVVLFVWVLWFARDAGRVNAQGFVNLNFDQTTLTPVVYPSETFYLATVPGWTWSPAENFQNNDPTTVALDDIALDDAAVTLHSTNSLFYPSAIQGNYSILLQGGSVWAQNTTNGASIGQTARIPFTAKSIIYWGGPLQVSFNGQMLSFIDISNAPNYTVWEADISADAGHLGQLLFSVPWQNEAMLDNIQFSSTPVPEPSVFTLVFLGLGLFGCRVKLLRTICLVTILFALTRDVSGQGFVDLNFESAIITNVSYYTIPAQDAFPGWTVSALYVVYDTFSLSGNAVTINDTNTETFFGTTHIQGNYFAVLEAGNTTAGPGAYSVSIGQTGQIPLSAKSIFFWGDESGLQVTFNNQPLSFNQTGSFSGHNIYGADVSAYAGQTGYLLFTQPAFSGVSLIDNIQFTSSPVSEPSTLSLLVLCALFFVWRFRMQAVVSPPS